MLKPTKMMDSPEGDKQVYYDKAATNNLAAAVIELAARDIYDDGLSMNKRLRAWYFFFSKNPKYRMERDFWLSNMEFDSETFIRDFKKELLGNIPMPKGTQELELLLKKLGQHEKHRREQEALVTRQLTAASKELKTSVPIDGVYDIVPLASGRTAKRYRPDRIRGKTDFAKIVFDIADIAKENNLAAWPKVARMLQTLYHPRIPLSLTDVSVPPELAAARDAEPPPFRTIARRTKVKNIDASVREYIKLRALVKDKRYFLLAALHLNILKEMDSGRTKEEIMAALLAENKKKQSQTSELKKMMAELDAVAKENKDWPKAKSLLLKIYDKHDNRRRIIPGIKDPMGASADDRAGRRSRTTSLMKLDYVDDIAAVVDEYVEIKHLNDRKNWRLIAALHKQIIAELKTMSIAEVISGHMSAAENNSAADSYIRVLKLVCEVDALVQTGRGEAWAVVKKKLLEIYAYENHVISGVKDPLNPDSENRKDKGVASSIMLRKHIDDIPSAVERYIESQLSVCRKRMRVVAVFHQQYLQRLRGPG